ncbi:helix-turn-helix domain-containing protein [Clostridium tyrobutyricum]|uniref:helix-turn-helix domain-containing protein n=1 Tax=Clostridium tyrobutyricum TaxID=1519 RepID=UPI001C383397|nr:helix-turn-helix transcriptional regulator [Clostridium tyrobutyricum]MBV4427607.1 helix-turn-helix domain-containing protein [Clostridium tyrobutyricum]MBV4442656.1 helix-turn-helix domain-containing protein [Clostridium tyrobutyricum]MBV4450206.1 helix-turn-helix domain-containing protein [Clostridium tyrobutyricum]MEA5008768.1 helix-turn-helix transcriptional regulator [Clostridium tyrobutyricum]
MLSPDKLKFLRLIHDVTQKEIGDEMGTSKNYISMMENGKRSYSKEQHNRYVNAVYKVSSIKKNKKVEEEQDNKYTK